MEIKGRIFYSDGTAVYEPTEVVLERGAERHKTRSDSSGYFHFKPEGQGYDSEGGQGALRFFVRGNRIDQRRIYFSRNPREIYLILPDLFGGGGGSEKGGLITGTVLDEDGSIFSGAKVRGIGTGGFLSFISGAPEAVCESDKRGRFALSFQGFASLKEISVDGNPPNRIFRKQSDGEEVDIPGSDLRAGSYNLFVVRQHKFLGLF